MQFCECCSANAVLQMQFSESLFYKLSSANINKIVNGVRYLPHRNVVVAAPIGLH